MTIIEINSGNVLTIAEALFANVDRKRYDSRFGVNCKTVNIYHDALNLLASFYELIYSSGYNPIKMFESIQSYYPAVEMRVIDKTIIAHLEELPSEMCSSFFTGFDLNEKIFNFPVLHEFIRLTGQVESMKVNIGVIEEGLGKERGFRRIGFLSSKLKRSKKQYEEDLKKLEEITNAIRSGKLSVFEKTKVAY